MKGKLGLFVSFAALAAVFWGVNWREFLSSVQRVNFLFVPICVASLGLAWLIRILRWRLLLSEGSRLSLRLLFDAWVLSLLATFLLPFRAGEFVRPVLLGREGVRYSAGFASVVVERAFDILALLALLALSTRELSSLPSSLLLGIKALGLLGGIIFLVMIFAFRAPRVVQRFVSILEKSSLGARFPHVLRKLHEASEEFCAGLAVVRTFPRLLAVCAWSIFLWLAMGLYFQSCLWAFNSFPSLWAGVMVNIVVALLVAAPSAPGFVGTYQLGCSVALCTLYGFSAEEALAYGIASHVLQYIVIVPLGFYTLATRGMRLDDLRRRSFDNTSNIPS